MQRVMIIGQPGSGKSTLARMMGEATGLPVYHIDHIHWMPGWQERDAAAKAQLCAQVHAKEEWIFEGGHSRTWDERLSRADTLIWLDFPIWLRLWRVIRRTLRYYGQSRPDLPQDCPERFSWEFFSWIWNTRKTGRTGCALCFDRASPPKSRQHLKTPTEVERFLKNLESA